MERREFIVKTLLLLGACAIPAGSFGAAEHVYKLAPLSMLPESIQNTPPEVRDAYRFAVLNRQVLQLHPVLLRLHRRRTYQQCVVLRQRTSRRRIGRSSIR
jgi:hypothetical protein